MLSVDQVSGNGNPIMSEKNEKKIKRWDMRRKTKEQKRLNYKA